jgi:DNA polymerase-3 subunit delta
LAAVADDLKPAYLIAGGDRPKIDRALARLRRRFAADAVDAHDADDTSGDDVVAACNALGLFASDGRLVVVEAIEKWKAPDVKAIATYLEAPAPATTLVLVGTAVKKDAPIVKAVARVGDVLLWDIVKKSLPSWVAEQFRVGGGSIDPDAARMLIELVGDDPYELATEADKLSAWAGGARVTESDVEQLVAPRAGLASFALTDAWGARDVAAVLRAAEGLLERTANPRSRTIPSVVATLTTHVARIRQCQALQADGVSSSDAAARLKQHPFYVKKLYTHARNYSRDELRQVTARLANLDHALKGGSRLSSDLELERALVEITAPEAAH